MNPVSSIDLLQENGVRLRTNKGMLEVLGIWKKVFDSVVHGFTPLGH